ncbi:hypothetical protein [Kaistia nematophila]|uniref:Uncharacterized protein n=1 Tax=Kaistia nematophila TaxID=2994654 RepID=A0A9X3E2N2_9HYPH|nr:hypothetical protein [Kaistia nematophila]MCX5570594.1 hypothetical protein [Kaistia nematophila]
MALMEESLRHSLLALAAAFEAATDISPATVGKRALNDNTFFHRLRDGRGFNVRTYDRLVAWFADEWPEHGAWPDDVERPKAEESA